MKKYFIFQSFRRYKHHKINESYSESYFLIVNRNKILGVTPL